LGPPAPGFGDPKARVLVVGSPPPPTAAIVPGDSSPAIDRRFPVRLAHRTGFANRSTSLAVDDGLTLLDLYLSAVVRCAPPENKPLPEERASCLPYLVRELRLLPTCGWWSPWARSPGRGDPGSSRSRPPCEPQTRLRAPREARVGPYALLGSYHPSQQNTFTGRLTPPMLDAAMLRAAGWPMLVVCVRHAPPGDRSPQPLRLAARSGRWLLIACSTSLITAAATYTESVAAAASSGCWNCPALRARSASTPVCRRFGRRRGRRGRAGHLRHAGRGHRPHFADRHDDGLFSGGRRGLGRCPLDPGWQLRDLETHASLAAGRWPEPGSRAVEATLSVGAAAAMASRWATG